jgi:hypothetical protein
MSETFRKHYSYGETVPILDTHVGITTDVYEDTDRQTRNGPYLKAVFSATAGPVKSLPLILEPLQGNDSKIIHLANIPVPIPFVRTVDMSLICDVVNYRWTPSPEGQRDNNGIVTFDLRSRCSFSVVGKSFTLQLDQRPCSVTLTKQLVQLPAQVQAAMGMPSAGRAEEVSAAGQAVAGQQAIRAEELTMAPGGWDGGGDPSSVIRNQLDIEERLRELGTRILSRA